MKRTRCLRSAFAAVALGFALVASASAQTPAPTPDPALAAVFAGESLTQADLMPKPELKCGIVCLNFHSTTRTIGGFGADCTTAQSSLNSQLQDIAKRACVDSYAFIGSCNVAIHDTTTCALTAGTWQIQGYATFNCKDTSC